MGTGLRVRRVKAFVLAAVFFVMVVIILLIASLFRLVPQEVRWSGDHRRETLAYYAATGGIKHGLAWLKKVRLGSLGESDPFLRTQASDPYENTTESNPGRSPLRLLPSSDPGLGQDTYFPSGIPVLRSKPGRIHLGEDWAAEVHIFPDKNTFPHPFLAGAGGTLAPCYIMVSLAYRDVNNNGRCDIGAGENYALRAETSMVERSFARYAYFVDLWKDLGPGLTPAFRVQQGLGEPLFSGPVHSNDTPVIEILNPLGFWGQSSFVAPFGDELSFSGDRGVLKAPDSYDGLGYLGGNFQGNSPDNRPYEGTAPAFTANAERYKRLLSEGQTAIRRTQRLAVPTDWTKLAKAAWGSTAGREVDVDAAPANQVFVNTKDLGIASTGALGELRLDVVDNQGKSQVFDNSMRVTGTATSGHQALSLVQAQEVTYVDGTKTIYGDVVTTETGPFSYDTTDTSDTPQPGYSPTSYQASIGETTETYPTYVVTGSITVNDPPGGAGPATGGTITIPQYGESMVTVTRTLYEARDRYVKITTITGDGPHPVTTQESIGEEPLLRHFAPKDAVITAVDHDLNFPTNYFLNGLTVDPQNPDPYVNPTVGAPNFPVFLGATTGVQITVPKGKSLVVHQDREKGQTFEASLLEGKPSGVIGVYGQVSGLHGVNRGSKTIFAADKDTTTRLRPTLLANVTITDNLLQYAVTPGTLPTSGDHALGVIGANITLPADPGFISLHNTATSALHIYASLFAAQGTFSSIQIPNVPAAMGELRIFGGVLQQQIGSLLRGSRGWSSRYKFDRFLSLNPPPTYPPDGRFDVTFFRVTAP